jgi:hypothetical protein
MSTSDCSYVSTNLMGMKFVNPNNPSQVNLFNAYLGFTNYVSEAAMNRVIASQELGQSRTPLQFLNDFNQTRQLLTDGDITQRVAPDGIMSYYFNDHAYSVIATLASNMAADFTVFEMGLAASVPGNSAAASTWRDHYTGIVKSFVPGSVAGSLLQANVNSVARYGTPVFPCPQ